MNGNIEQASLPLLERAVTFGRMVKFSHSVFALPFAIASGAIAVATQRITLSALDVLLLVICMVRARTAAMAFNRIADRDTDAINPRTRARELPTGRVKPSEA